MFELQKRKILKVKKEIISFLEILSIKASIMLVLLEINKIRGILGQVNAQPIVYVRAGGVSA